MSTQKKSCLFLQQVTTIDYAYINNEGQIVGGSYNADFEVTGDVEANEQVVIDFGKVKSSIKQIIDGKFHGFDHKLWVINGYSNLEVYDSNLDIKDLVYIRTPIQELTLPITATKVLASNKFEEIIAQQVEDGLHVVYPNANVKVKCELNNNPSIPSGCNSWSYFSYTHGLKHSSSWGCKNIAHGHLSFIGVDHEPMKEFYFDEILDMIDGANFINAENLSTSYPDPGLTKVTYNTSDRGIFYHEFNTNKVNHIIMSTETTIENIIAWVKLEFGDFLKEQGATRLYLSEGLMKGACVDL